MNSSRLVRVLAVHCLCLAGQVGAQCRFSDSPARGRPVLTYRFSTSTAADTTILRVTLEFTGSASGMDTLSLPSQWAGERLHALRNLHAVDGQTEIDSIPNRMPRLLRHPRGARVRVEYELTKDWSGPFNHPYEFHPIIFADFIEFTGENAFAYPRMDPYTPIVAQFDWSGIPASWALATSFGSAASSTEMRAGAQDSNRCQTFSGTWHAVYDALYSAGKLRIHRFAIRGKPAVLAIRGAWTFSDSAVVSEIQRDVGFVRAFWRDDDFPYFLVTWAPFDRDHGSDDGTAFTNAIWIFSSKLDALSTQVTQLTHEAFHAWDPRRMGQQVAAEERRLGWFHEGFTMYYADLIAYRGGALSLASVVDEANRDLSSFAGSTDSYTRGEVIARWLDGAIREHSQGKRSLDDVMRDMVRESNTPLSLDRILSTADRYLAGSDRAILRDLASGSGPPPATLSAGALASCVRVALDSAYAFDAGFNVTESVASHRVTGVQQGGVAYAAGLRDGQGLVGLSIYNGRPDRPATFTILMDSMRQRITYYPRGTGAIVPQLHILDGARDMECVPANERLRP